MKKDIKIAVSGKSGCGNTTVSRRLAETLGIRFINFTFRSLAEEKNLSLEEVLPLAAQDDWWDREVDRRQVALARENGGCVLGSRLAIWMLPEADLKVYLTARPETRARRILEREGGSLEDVAAFTSERDKQDRERYIRIYGIDNDDYSFADLTIDTDNLNPGQIVDIIIQEAEKKFPS
ncbi:(d)CMP kinase [Breznakiella homolactica]|uniref:Cytidylate kinase n=1 Tax=Breznakiella homolactica TaxID=2798577 RepID=A0A7T8B7Z3_9SPIR|nr:AAA family ATPase [Breznakiella homolactica]QQO08044.1 AAA family ATPase [Breznakiella homolactica]